MGTRDGTKRLLNGIRPREGSPELYGCHREDTEGAVGEILMSPERGLEQK